MQARGIKNLLVAGVTTDVCVATTITGANDRGFNAIAISDCVASYSLERHTATLEIIKAQGGIFGWVTGPLLCPYNDHAFPAEVGRASVQNPLSVFRRF